MKRQQRVVAYACRRQLRPVGAASPCWHDQLGELRKDAVLREVREETGKVGFEIERYLGAAEYDMRPYADVISPSRVDGLRTGDTANDPINFRFYWLPLSQGHVLAAGQGALLGRLFD